MRAAEGALDDHDVSHIDGNLWIGACPESSLPDFFAYVLNLYQAEPYGTHPNTVVRTQRMDDSDVLPGAEILEDLAAWVNEKRALGPTLVHCQAGLNRSGLIAGLALIRSGIAPRDAIALLRQKRSSDVLFNKAFEQWLLGLANLRDA
jgi:Dual specificity phosphatase, catalytic domain